MNIDNFLSHHGLTENPFEAEEARHDRVFDRLIDANSRHPDFTKILGRVDRPSTSVVFGEKGSGKTAIRLTIGKRVAEWNAENPDRRVLLVAYDELNPELDRITSRQRRKQGMFHKSKGDEVEELLRGVRLEDHQDAILTRAVTKLIDEVTGVSPESDDRVHLPGPASSVLRALPRQMRGNLAVLAALYDRPRSGSVLERFHHLRKLLGLGMTFPGRAVTVLGGLLLAAALGLFIASKFMAGDPGDVLPGWMMPVMWTCLGLGAVALLASLWHQVTIGLLARRLQKAIVVVERSSGQLATMLKKIPYRDRSSQPWPGKGIGGEEARYQLTQRLMDLLDRLGYIGMMVLVDRVDEPTTIIGKSNRMRAVIWPMFDNKFLQQDRIGLKLLLPVELRHALRKESADFFAEARMDKQSVVDPLTWSGAVLYDLCSNRIKACRKDDAADTKLTDLFEDDVTEDRLVGALDQMHQPRDAFKFMYQVIQEHCRMVPDDRAKFQIPGLTLETVARQQAERVQNLHRGLAPA